MFSVRRTLNNVCAKATRRFCSPVIPPELTVREALNTVLHQEFERDQTHILLGEEVADYQGAYKISKGMVQKFGSDRIIDTPITEMGFTGMGVGSALNGLKPVVEFMSFNFSMQSMDHIINSAAKLLYMSGGKINVPITFRGTNGAAKAVGAQHSQDFSAWYSSVPGLNVVAIYDSEDAIGLLRACLRNPDPCIVLENEMLYGASFQVSKEAQDPNFVLPLGKADIRREGSDITLISHGRMVENVDAAAVELAKEGINAEVINLRSIRPLDRDAIIASVKKTNRLVTCEEGWPQCGVGAEICALMMESEAFDYLDAPVERVCATDVPMPYCVDLEDMVLPKPEDVLSAARRCLYREPKGVSLGNVGQKNDAVRSHHNLKFN